MAAKKKTAKTKKGSAGSKLMPAATSAPPGPNRWPVWAQRFAASVDRIARLPRFAKIYVGGALAVLLVTTVGWSVASAAVQAQNADQLVDAYLFGSGAALHGASFPGAHSFLLKWLLFWLMRLFDFSAGSFMAVTVALVLLTVGALVFLLYKIERRPLVFGTLCLALASVLLLVPAQPYPGALLPVNMAMITTRNVEYALFAGALALLAGLPKIRSWRFAWAAIILSVLGASDKLFMLLGVAGAAAALVAYSLARRWTSVTMAVRWLVADGVGAVGAIALLAAVNLSGLTHVAAQGQAAPYGVAGAKAVALAAVYGVLGLFSTFGANPAANDTLLRALPREAAHGLLGWGGPAYVINFVIMAVSLAALGRVLWAGLAKRRGPSNRAERPDAVVRLTTMLGWSSIAALAAFIAGNHYYAVDARYLAVSLFAGFAGLAVFARKRHWRPAMAVVAGAVCVAGIGFGSLAATRTYQAEKTALSSIDRRNTLVARALQQHSGSVLVGDYWRVLPIKLAAGGKLPVVPMASCTQPQTTPGSQAWQPDLHHHAFAYLLSADKGLSGYPACTAAQVAKVYGYPDSSVLIAGTLAQPQEQLLIYGHGINPVRPQGLSAPRADNAIMPIGLNQLPHATCDAPTLMTVVAHQDDDLLFTNPDLLNTLKTGACVRTVYVTAGDAGGNQFYWLGREQGAEAAYGVMIGDPQVRWASRTVELAAHEYATVASPQGHDNVALVFLHLPDGNLHGQGFRASQFESLAQLDAGKITAIHSVDGQSTYTRGQLVAALTSLMRVFAPTAVHTQSTDPGQAVADHSDHNAVGRLAGAAFARYAAAQGQNAGNGAPPALTYYLGYPVRQLPANVSGPELQAKQAAFFAYAKFDGGVCESVASCSDGPAYGAYLERQYPHDN